MRNSSRGDGTDRGWGFWCANNNIRDTQATVNHSKFLGGVGCWTENSLSILLRDICSSFPQSLNVDLLKYVKVGRSEPGSLELRLCCYTRCQEWEVSWQLFTILNERLKIFTHPVSDKKKNWIIINIFSLEPCLLLSRLSMQM